VIANIKEAINSNLTFIICLPVVDGVLSKANHREHRENIRYQ